MEILKSILKPYLNIRFIISFFIAWMITNGWSYIALIIGTKFKISWLTTVAGSYQAFLWMPWTPEKLITIPIAIWFHKLFFPKDFKTISQFNNMLKKIEIKKKK